MSLSLPALYTSLLAAAVPWQQTFCPSTRALQDPAASLLETELLVGSGFFQAWWPPFLLRDSKGQQSPCKGPTPTPGCPWRLDSIPLLLGQPRGLPLAPCPPRPGQFSPAKGLHFDSSAHWQEDCRGSWGLVTSILQAEPFWGAWQWRGEKTNPAM